MSNNDDSESYYMSSDDVSDAGSHETGFTSLADALAHMSERLAELDVGLDDMVDAVTSMEQPVQGVALGTFVQPRVLESAPFRQTVFRLKPAAVKALDVAKDTVTFAELCERIREKGADLAELLDLPANKITLLYALQRMDSLVF